MLSWRCIYEAVLHVLVIAQYGLLALHMNVRTDDDRSLIVLLI